MSPELVLSHREAWERHHLPVEGSYGFVQSRSMGGTLVTFIQLCVVVWKIVSGVVDLTTQAPTCPGETVTFSCNVSSSLFQWEVPDLGIYKSLVAEDLGIPMVVGPFVFISTSFDAGPPVQSVSTASVAVTAMLNGIVIRCTDGSGHNGESDSTTILVIVENPINVTTVTSGTTATLTVSYSRCIREPSMNLEVMCTYNMHGESRYTLSSVSLIGAPTDFPGFQTEIELKGLNEGTGYEFRVWLVRISDGETIGVETSGSFITRGGQSDEVITLTTATSISLTVVITLVVSVTLGAVVTGVICYNCVYFKDSTSQPEGPVYEMSGENWRPSMNHEVDNQTDGPVDPQCPEYDVPGGGGGAMT